MKWVVVVVLVGGLVWFGRNWNNKSTQQKILNNTSVSEERITISPILTSTPSPTLTPVKQVVKTTVVTTGITRGQAVCNYEIPATPNSFGKATVETNWNNLTRGKNGKFQAVLCVSVGGKSAVVSENERQNGKMVSDIPWVARNAQYTFSLYDGVGGDVDSCSGISLSSCQITTN